MPETEALAILRAGGSFEQAAEISGLSVEEVQKLWAEQESPSPVN